VSSRWSHDLPPSLPPTPPPSPLSFSSSLPPPINPISCDDDEDDKDEHEDDPHHSLSLFNSIHQKPLKPFTPSPPLHRFHGTTDVLAGLFLGAGWAAMSFRHVFPSHDHLIRAKERKTLHEIVDALSLLSP